MPQSLISPLTGEYVIKTEMERDISKFKHSYIDHPADVPGHPVSVDEDRVLCPLGKYAISHVRALPDELGVQLLLDGDMEGAYCFMSFGGPHFDPPRVLLVFRRELWDMTYIMERRTPGMM